MKTKTLILTITAMLVFGALACLYIDKAVKERLPAGAGVPTYESVPLQADPDPEVTFENYLEEIELVERVVAAEAQGECIEGQMGVALVIADRAKLWNMTLTEVVTQPGQFADPFQGDISDLTKEAVYRTLELGERIFEGPVTHFDTGAPWWATNKEFIGSIGKHNFWY